MRSINLHFTYLLTYINDAPATALHYITLIIFIHQLDGRLNIIMKVNLTNYNHAVHKVKHKARHALVDKTEHKTTTPYVILQIILR